MQVLTVKVVPQAKRESVVQQSATNFTIYVTEPAQKGKANKAMLKALSKHLHVRPSDLILSKGERFNEKTVLLLENKTA
ncbi:DUF167 domain-containing protein [Candidatus Woesebacteria bacterium]|nr:DUF167 domain-containing protein [Candidatus Woesebacteria bacterium]MCD8507107.1 DUF167 domain-containing protein [Candidatus Woesebacteria bacterium]MCD8526922.1 DUF167 domain-containing protein [Candidatus Woesebacteria bacterium]MCD8546071.1 DUF167 domain-containing protein [Candidatus Woesebacteria bacterium]